MTEDATFALRLRHLPLTTGSRRAFIRGMAGSLASLATGPAVAQGFGWWESAPPERAAPRRPVVRRPPELPLEQLAVPDFTAFHDEMPFVAGVRPYRHGGVRLELAPPSEAEVGTRHVIHNYGHGGAGVSLAFGTAETAADLARRLIETRLAGTPPLAFAVLGAGIVGLATALALANRWPKSAITIYAREQDARRTTSFLAGGQFATLASLPEYHTEALEELAERQLSRSREQLENFERRGLHRRFGISRRRSYSLSPDVSHNVRLRLGSAIVAARAYDTWLIDPTRMMPALRADLASRGVAFVTRDFVNRADVLQLPEPVIVNCTGLGARDLFADPQLEPRRGHLVMLKNPGKLDYFLNSWCGAMRPRYLFARHDDIVLGGTSQRGADRDHFDEDDSGDVSACVRILQSAKALYSKGASAC